MLHSLYFIANRIVRIFCLSSILDDFFDEKPLRGLFQVQTGALIYSECFRYFGLLNHCVPLVFDFICFITFVPRHLN